MNKEISSATAARVKVEGRVQGVGFRYFVYRFAKRNDITGWVRNLDDGSVEAHFEGPENKVSQLIQLCHEGPVGSNVKKVTISEEEPANRWDSFNFRYE
ncbi:MAG: acylphosphatase [Candidatus Cyclonatronum sp.]|uniref:acylphosphatase n=1 Tax=Cyclonatronum sp. TaxID=3024185 RepID=UPI0025BA39C3|nr:acylphosphatase [Cyclonatronum sp.]MCC5934416.1 acylphosphatase [Balneolales bacterium]MCH8488075.1 acylphosphatase [Cyclonatronum sp.]